MIKKSGFAQCYRLPIFCHEKNEHLLIDKQKFFAMDGIFKNLIGSDY